MSYLLTLLLSASISSYNSRPTSHVLISPAPVHMTGMTKNMLTRLEETDIQLRMQTLTNWTTDGSSLFYTRTFENFLESIAFVNSLVEPAEQLGHHPDITINYNQVSLKLTTHDAQGLTDLDFQLAKKISQL